MSPGKKLRVLKKQYEDCWKYPPPQNDVKIDKYVACNERPPSDGKGVRVNQPCWLSPGMSSNVRYGPCWDYPPQRFKRFPLPPPCRGSTLPVSALIPNFDKCISHYTRYDFTLEKCVHEQILVVEGQLRNMERQLAATKEVEISLAKIMREQAIRRRLLIGSACGIKIYPEYLSQIAENDAMCSFQHCYNTLNSYKYYWVKFMHSVLHFSSFSAMSYRLRLSLYGIPCLSCEFASINWIRRWKVHSSQLLKPFFQLYSICTNISLR